MSRDMDRRRVLKAAGALGVGTLATVGSVAAQEDEQCVETVESVQRSEVIGPPVVPVSERLPVGGTPPGVALKWQTEPFTLGETVFEDSDLEENRLRVDLAWNQWNPAGQGPTQLRVDVERQNFGGQWEVIGRQESQATDDLSNSREFLVEDGGTIVVEAENETVSDRRNDVIVEGGQTYRIGVWYDQGAGTLDLTVDGQAYDPACFDEE